VLLWAIALIVERPSLRAVTLPAASNSHGSTQTGVYIAVLPILVDDIKISSTSDTLVIGESAQLHVTISPNDGPFINTA
jgi:uncharacterized protein YjdB